MNSNCSGICTPGYICPVGSSRSTQEVCGGTHVYCPLGSSLPTLVSVGYFTTGGTNESTRYNQTICPVGHYCDQGQVIECPPGRYGAVQGMSSSDCSGPCAAGYYCPSASVSATQVRAIVGISLFLWLCVTWLELVTVLSAFCRATM
jgi:hypothetical protein